MNDFVKAVKLDHLSQAHCKDIQAKTQSIIAKWFKNELSVLIANNAPSDSKCLLSADGERVLGISSVEHWLQMSLGTDPNSLNLSESLRNKAVTLFMHELLRAFNKTNEQIESLKLDSVNGAVPAPYQLNLSVSAGECDFVLTFYPAFFLCSLSTSPNKEISGCWQNVFAGNDIRLDVNAGKVRLTLAELAEIGVGDVLPLGHAIKNEFQITIKDRLITHARLATQQGQRVAVVQSSEGE